MENPVSGSEFKRLALSVHRNDAGAAECLVRSYQNQLFSFALRMLRNPMDAQEVTQDAFVRAIKALTVQYNPERCRRLALRPWLFRITRNLAYNRNRARRRLSEEQLEPASDGHKAAIRGMARGQSESRPACEAETLDRALERLDSKSRELVLLRFLEELPYADVAAAAGTTEAAARAKVFRALRKLREIMSAMETRNAL